MSSLTPDDLDMHHSDGGHRWICPVPGATAADDAGWILRLNAHLDLHRETYGGSMPRPTRRAANTLET